jgi:hypothetical protein
MYQSVPSVTQYTVPSPEYSVGKGRPSSWLMDLLSISALMTIQMKFQASMTNNEI